MENQWTLSLLAPGVLHRKGRGRQLLMIMKRLTYLVIFLCQYANGQDLPPGFKSWLGVGVEARASTRLTLKFSRMYSFEAGSSYDLQFSQSGLSGEYALRKATRLTGGYTSYYFKSRNRFVLYHKISAGVRFRRLLGHRIKNAFRVEWYLPQQKKYRLRGIYSISYSFKHKMRFWKGRPFVKGQVYYYYGGKPYSFYDQEENLLAYQAPNDFHRFRVTGGVVFHPVKNLKATLYYIWNKEFNTNLSGYRDLNIPSKKGTKIKYPFNDYSVIGLSFVYKLKLY